MCVTQQSKNKPQTKIHRHHNHHNHRSKHAWCVPRPPRRKHCAAYNQWLRTLYGVSLSPSSPMFCDAIPDSTLGLWNNPKRTPQQTHSTQVAVVIMFIHSSELRRHNTTQLPDVARVHSYTHTLGQTHPHTHTCAHSARTQPSRQRTWRMFPNDAGRNGDPFTFATHIYTKNFIFNAVTRMVVVVMSTYNVCVCATHYVCVCVTSYVVWRAFAPLRIFKLSIVDSPRSVCYQPATESCAIPSLTFIYIQKHICKLWVSIQLFDKILLLLSLWTGLFTWIHATQLTAKLHTASALLSLQRVWIPFCSSAACPRTWTVLKNVVARKIPIQPEKEIPQHIGDKCVTQSPPPISLMIILGIGRIVEYHEFRENKNSPLTLNRHSTTSPKKPK